MSVTFEVVDSKPNNKTAQSCHVYLREDTWDDFGYRTTFRLYFLNSDSQIVDLGRIKIASLDMAEPCENQSSKVDIPRFFEGLSNRFFSIAESEDFYIRLNSLQELDGSFILRALRDMAQTLTIFDQVESEEVTKVSLLRQWTPYSVRHKLHRLSNGGAPLQPYNFTISPKSTENPDWKMDFFVEVDSMPPSHVHALIGKNGVGKTSLFHDLMTGRGTTTIQHNSVGVFNDEQSEDFANLVFVSFSAFDKFDASDNKDEKLKYIGLKKTTVANKTVEELAGEFVDSLEQCMLGNKLIRFGKIVKILDTDSHFKELNLDKEVMGDYDASGDGVMDGRTKEKYTNLFMGMSSGHKIILLSLTRLVLEVEEKSLVLVDEPESHLHPPLLSSYVRALSTLMIDRNAVTIFATHSPVVLQEIPNSCVWILSKSGERRKAERPLVETFGENIGTLTREVFSLEYENSGYHELVRNAAKNLDNFTEILEKFEGHLGSEAKALSMAALLYKENNNYASD